MYEEMHYWRHGDTQCLESQLNIMLNNVKKRYGQRRPRLEGAEGGDVLLGDGVAAHLLRPHHDGGLRPQQGVRACGDAVVYSEELLH